MEKLLKIIRQQVAITEEELQEISQLFTPLSLRKETFLLQRGQLCTSYYFIESGALRIVYQQDGRDYTGWMAFDGQLFTELESFRSGNPTRFSIQAIADTTLWLLSRTAHEKLLRHSFAWQDFIRQGWEEAFTQVVQAVLSFQSQTADQRYEQWRQQEVFSERVPLKHLSSFLGVTPTSLSRIRKKK